MMMMLYKTHNFSQFQPELIMEELIEATTAAPANFSDVWVKNQTMQTAEKGYELEAAPVRIPQSLLTFSVGPSLIPLLLHSNIA